MRTGETATEAGGTHPTGMHTCLLTKQVIPKNGLQLQLIRYDTSIDADVPNHLLTPRVNGVNGS